jgi:hypothetical protein
MLTHVIVPLPINSKPLWSCTSKRIECFSAFGMWQVMCFSQRKGDLENNDDTVINHQAEQKRALYLQLGEKILQKANEENKIGVQ